MLQNTIKKGKEVFIADNARVIGRVELGDEVSVWFGAVLRGDIDEIKIGNRTNLQDNVVIHVDKNSPCIIGDECIIGHGAIVHGAKLANNVLVGMHATVLNDVEIGEYSIIGAGAVVSQGVKIPPFSLVLGVPGKVVKTYDESIKARIRQNAQNYIDLSKIYLQL
ncbi:MAG: gamma carbonic anhydrase family protein [Bacteroidia bacterium]|nr:gamma carbonic anhydrase family protein [Bacteroidia bacterium]MCO5254757.1 gamma carbonic anhydrase family protein [Bacteroidota bacterium]